MAPKDMKEAAVQDDSLAGLLPSTRTMRFGDTVVTVRELAIGEIAPLVEQFRRVLATMRTSDADVLDFVRANPRETAEVAAAVTGIPAATWTRAGASKLVAVLTVAAEVNADFFVQCVGLGAILGALTVGSDGAGQTPSATSSAPDTTPR